MKRKDEFNKAVCWCIIFVWSIYFVFGDMGALLYLHDPMGVSENILNNLPPFSIIAILVKIAMSMVCLLSYPLTFVPPSSMIETFVIQVAPPALQTVLTASYQTIPDDSTDSRTSDTETPPLKSDPTCATPLSLEPNTLFRCGNRLVVVCVSTLIAAYMPCFGMVITILGCFTVAILSFVLPPLLHLILVTIPALKHDSMTIRIPPNSSNSYQNEAQEHNPLFSVRSFQLHFPPKTQFYFDTLLAICGVLLCGFGTWMSVSDALNKLQHGLHC